MKPVLLACILLLASCCNENRGRSACFKYAEVEDTVDDQLFDLDPLQVSIINWAYYPTPQKEVVVDPEEIRHNKQMVLGLKLTKALARIERDNELRDCGCEDEMEEMLLDARMRIQNDNIVKGLRKELGLPADGSGDNEYVKVVFATR